MKWTNAIVIIILSTIFFTSCVSYRKFEDLEKSKYQLEEEHSNYKEKMKKAEEENEYLTTELQQTQTNLQEVSKDFTTEKERYNRLETTNRDIMDRYDRLLDQNQTMLTATSSEKRDLTERLGVQEEQLDRRDRELKSKEEKVERLQKELEAKIKDYESKMGTLQGNLGKREARVQELEAALAAKEARMEALQEKVSKALMGFSDADLNVVKKDGKIYVTLSQNLLFAPGSKRIDRKGKEAIKKLAVALSGHSEINVNIEGHTDADGDANSNWDLSVLRATSILKELVQNGVNEKQVTASGRGEFYPVAPNDTRENKAKNRRTEIILSPKLDILYEVMK